ncbi:MAG: hypothetical protein IKV90_06570, partial [Clostridia bacterium]|nr:hypothetical protein [Clostridia bacterium]
MRHKHPSDFFGFAAANPPDGRICRAAAMCPLGRMWIFPGARLRHPAPKSLQTQAFFFSAGKRRRKNAGISAGEGAASDSRKQQEALPASAKRKGLRRKNQRNQSKQARKVFPIAFERQMVYCSMVFFRAARRMAANHQEELDHERKAEYPCHLRQLC